MLRISGELADGAITNWAGPAALAGHIVPAVTAAAARAGRPAPRVVAMVLVSITSDEAGLRRWVAEKFGVAGQIAGYRATLDQGGAAGPEDVVVVGDERSVERQLQRLIDAGATELVAMTFGSDAERERTIQALEGMRSKAARD
jgi:alkanesulfonate monooxygenase SsuD/methylene tetrahydromethanopterin reductase-like flavin-dependent oxidoreductase (luciferase family)